MIVAVGGSPKGRRPDDLRKAKGNGTGLVAFDEKSGKVLWKATDELASYSSPVVRKVGGNDVCLYFARGGLVGVDPKDGTEVFRHAWRAKILESVNAANPVVAKDEILVTECYGPGGVLLKIKDGKAEEVWTDADKEKRERSLACHWNTPIRVGGFVYGSQRPSRERGRVCAASSGGRARWRGASRGWSGRRCC